jgi:hypothetical protein
LILFYFSKNWNQQFFDSIIFSEVELMIL